MNTQLFLLINASDQASKLFIYFAIFCANYLMYLPIVVITIYCFFKSSYRLLVIKMILSLGLALLITFIIRHLFYSPRPFAVNIGTNYLLHDQTSSLPSQHAVFVWTICLTVCLNYARCFKKLVFLLVLVAVLVSWSRIYLGIHWPLDIAVGFLVSMVSVYIIKKFWFLIHPVIKRLLSHKKNSIDS